MKFLDLNDQTPENVNFSFMYRGYTISATNILNKPHIVSVGYYEGSDGEFHTANTVQSAIVAIDTLYG